MKTQVEQINNLRKWGWWAGRIALATFLLFFGLAVAFFLAGRFAREEQIKQYPAPVQLEEAVRPLLAQEQAGASPSVPADTADRASAKPAVGALLEGPVAKPKEELALPATPEPTPTAAPAEATFTLRTIFQDGRMLYKGVGGDIDGVINPTLVVAPGTTVRAILVNGDGMTHDLYFPDFEVKAAEVGRKGQTAEVTFLVTADQSGTYVYYCTLPGHRQSGQEGQFIVRP